MTILKKRYFIKSIGILLLVVILFNVDLDEVIDHLRQCDPIPLVLAIMLIVPQVALRALRWQGLLVLQGVHCPWTRTLTFYFAAIFAGLVTPGRLGEFAKSVFLKQHGLATIGYSLPSVLADRVFDLVVLAAIALLALPRFALFPQAGVLAALGLALMAIITVAGLKWMGTTDRMILIAGRLKSRVGKNWSGSLDDFVRGARALVSARLVTAMLLTIASYGIYFTQTYLIGRAMGLPLDYTQIAMVVAAGILIGYVPITVAGLGTREAVLILLFGRLGIPTAGALSFAFLYNLVYIAGVGIISAGFWMKLPDRQALRKKPAKPTGRGGN
jgi:uncharacterized protein (TIRG00374 family)